MCSHYYVYVCMYDMQHLMCARNHEIHSLGAGLGMGCTRHPLVNVSMEVLMYFNVGDEW